MGTCKSVRGSLILGVALAGSAAFGQAAFAAGIGVPEQDTNAIAQSTAGETTESAASLSYYNPAGMVLIDGDELQTSLTYYDIHSDVNSTLIPNAEAPNGPGLTGHATGFVESTLVSTAFGVFSLPYGIKAGFSITEPDAGRVKYPSDFAGNYEGDEALLTDIQMGFDVAVPVYRGLSIGGGPIVDYFQSVLGVTQNLPLGLGAETPNGDGASGHFNGKSYAFGYNIGAMYQFTPGLRIGVDYRSQIKHDIKGNEVLNSGSVSAILGSLGLQGAPATSNASDNFLFPQTVSFGVFDQLNPQWAVMANAQWVNWAAYQSLFINDSANTQAYLVGPNISPVVESFKFRNAWTIGIGTSYTPTIFPKLKLMSGIGYDESPVSGATTRVTGLPDNNRVMLGIGEDYQLTSWLALQAAYAHYFIQNGGIDDQRLAVNGATAYAGTLVGEYKLSADVFNAGLDAKF